MYAKEINRMLEKGLELARLLKDESCAFRLEDLEPQDSINHLEAADDSTFVEHKVKLDYNPNN